MLWNCSGEKETARKSNQSLQKRNQSWIFIGRIEAEAEAPYFGHLMQIWLIGKDHDAGKDWRQKKKGAAENEMIR